MLLCPRSLCVNLLNTPGERAHLFWPQRTSMMLNTGTIQQLGALKNHCDCHIMSRNEKLTSETQRREKKKALIMIKKKKKKTDSPMCLSDSSIIPDSSKHFSQKTFPGCSGLPFLTGDRGSAKTRRCPSALTEYKRPEETGARNLPESGVSLTLTHPCHFQVPPLSV